MQPRPAAEAYQPLAHRSRFRSQLVELDAALDQTLARARVPGEGGKDVIGGKRIREDPHADATTDQLLDLGDATVEGDEIGRFDQELGLQLVEALEESLVHHAQARVVDRGRVVEHDPRGGPYEAADDGGQLRGQALDILVQGVRIAALRDRLADASNLFAEIRVAVRPIDQGRDWHRPFSVPEPVEDLGQIPDDGPGRGDVEIAKVALVVHLEVGVAHVAPADDGHRVVHHHQLVVHAVIDAIEVGHEAKQPGPAMREGVEQADLDVRVRVERRDPRVAVLDVDVVDQDTHPDAAVSGAHEAIGQDAAGRIGLPEEVLDVEGRLCEIRQGHAGGERLAPVRDERERGFARVLGREGGDLLADGGGFVVEERGRLRAGVVLRQRGAGPDQQERYRQRRAHAPPIGPGALGSRGARPARVGGLALGMRRHRMDHSRARDCYAGAPPARAQ